MEQAPRLFSRGRSREALNLECRPAEGLYEETRNPKILQMIDDPRVLARGNINNCGNQQTLARSVSICNLPHQRLEKNPFRGSPGIEQDEPFIALEDEISITDDSHEAKSFRFRRGRIVSIAGRGRFFWKRDDRLRRLRHEDRLRSNRLRVTRKILTRPNQHAAGGIKDSSLQHLRSPETYLALRGMDVAIDIFEVHFNMKHANGVLATLNHPDVRLAKRLLDGRTVNGTPVENHKLLETIPPPLARTRDKARKPQPIALEDFDIQKFRQMPAAEEVSNANRQAFGPRKCRNRETISPALKRHRRVRQGNTVQPVYDMGRLGLLASKKPPASRKVVEDVANLDVRPRRNPNFPNSFNLASRYNHFRAGFGRSFSGGQSEPRNARDAGQGLAPKAHRSHASKICRAANLARRMALKAQEGILPVHAAAVITH
jgi:hypothetical protein